MGQGNPGCLFVEDRQGLAVELGAAGRVGHRAGFADQPVERLVAPAGLVLP
ncbi:hypothetical protein D9M68_1008340 [compost metagenome]